MTRQITRVLEGDAVPSNLPPSVRKYGVVEDIDVSLADDEYHIEIRQTIWERNRRRTTSQRGNKILQQNVLLRLPAQDAAKLVEHLAWTLLHADGRGPKEA